jgi:hypothetical protein
MPPANAESRSSGGRILLGPICTLSDRVPPLHCVRLGPLSRRSAFRQPLARASLGGAGWRGTPDAPAATTAGSGPAEQQKPLR